MDLQQFTSIQSEMLTLTMLNATYVVPTLMTMTADRDMSFLLPVF